MRLYLKKIKNGHIFTDIIESHPSLPEEIRTEFVDMQTRYRGVELDRRMSIEEKIPHMIDWAQNGEDLFVKAKVKRHQLPQMVQDSHVFLRDGFNDLVEILHDFNIPLLIFSAGLGDVMEEVLRQCSRVTPHMKCVANYLEFDKNDHLSGFQGELIHTFNKNGRFVQDDIEWCRKTQNRKNVILLGDMVGDVTMASGIVDPNISLNIGFLNCDYEELLDTYLDQFDIVLENDQTMDVANAIIAEIVKS